MTLTRLLFSIAPLPILLSVPLSPAYRPNERPSSFNFQKARWDAFASYFDFHCLSAEKYSSFSLSSAAALITSLALNAAKSSIPFGRIKRPPKAWWSAEVESAVSERRKAFAAAHRSDEDRQAYISASRRASSVIAKAKAEAWQTTCSSLSPESNPNLCTLFFAISLALLPRLPTLLTSPTLLLSEASLPPLRVTLTHFTLLSYEFHFILPFISLHSTSSKEALLACPPLSSLESSFVHRGIHLFLSMFPLSSSSLSPILTLSPLMIWYSGQTALLLFLLARAAPAFLPTALSVALRPLFSFRQAQYVSVFPLKPAPFCTLFAGLGNTIKSAISLLLLSDSRSVLTTLSSPLSFFLSQTLWQIWQELSTLFSCSIRLQWVPGHSFLPGNDAADELARRGALLAPSAIPCGLFPLTSRIHSRLFLDWSRTVSSKYFDTQVPSISTEELKLPRHTRCVLSRLRCNGHSLLLDSYLSRIGRIENPSCSACRHSSQDISHLILHCPATDSLRRSLFGNSLSLYDLWTQCRKHESLVLFLKKGLDRVKCLKNLANLRHPFLPPPKSASTGFEMKTPQNLS